MNPDSKRKWRESSKYLLVVVISLLVSTTLICFSYGSIKRFTEIGDAERFEGILEYHGRDSEGVLLHEGKRFYVRSNEGTMNRAIAHAKKNDHVSGYFLKSTCNVVELFINGKQIASFDDYHRYEIWERQFMFWMGFMQLVFTIGLSWKTWKLIRENK